MAVAVVTVAGRIYRIGCAEGQEPRISELGRLLDERIAAMHKSFGEIGDQRIVVMAALEIADEGADAKDRVLALQSEIEALRDELALRDRRDAELVGQLAESLDVASQRLERLARDLARDDAALELP
ncbi:MAG TPA: cell division protein ZapA [Methylocystis sp.]|nr:cell division protein ZapA [Methylocystis sp.]